MDYQFGPGPLQVDQNTIDEKIKGDIGIVENGDVATHAIPSGYYVIWKGDLYVAKTDISSGTTLSSASNGNLTAKTQGIGADVAALNSKLTIINGVHNNSDLPSAYGFGLTIDRCGSGQGFPYNYASIITLKNSGGYTAQLLIQSGGHMAFRASPGDDNWGNWVTVI